MTTINMQTMRYINLLDRASKVKTRKCFVYNDAIYFAVPKGLISKAIGPDASNIRKLQEKLGKKVKIIKEANETGEIPKFIENIVSPIRFKSIEVREGNLIITAGNNQNKASLIGRNKRRLEELGKIVSDLYGMELRIV